MSKQANRPILPNTLQDHLFNYEEIAIIGMGCRLPGKVKSPDDLWQLLCDGVDPIAVVPKDRWDVRSYYDPNQSKAGKVSSQWGGYLENIDQFDADFFGISPREAARIDPQHRILLEVAYEAMEDAGFAPEQLSGSRTGVFIGISTCDYGAIQECPTERHSIDAYTNIGLGMCIAANRISHQFDFHGPSFSVDTACSSSLVAVHLACRSIQNGECDLAIAGGVNVLLRPEGTIGFSKASMLAPDGRCKSFDARANGYVRSEGVGAVVLKRLSEALVDRDPIHAVVRGTMVNQDGRTPGLALPNRVAQESMLREVYESAGIAPGEIYFMEAHGTGTPAGDPIELNAIGNVLGKERQPGNECVVGSIKSNLGHLEAASGIAGLIKTALCVKYGVIPPTLHFEVPNPNIAFEQLHLRVARVAEPWPTNGSSTRLAGVNSFGFGGTNAHIILESPPAAVEPASAVQGSGAIILPIAARSPEALKALAARYREFLAEDNNTDIPLRDISYSAALHRGHGDHRLTIVGHSRQEMIEQLDAFAADEPRLYMATGRRTHNRPEKLVFVFSGMGPQWWAMGRQFLEHEPVFRDTVMMCDSIHKDLAGWSVLTELTRDEGHSRINDTQIAQPAIFAVQAGLAALWRSWGIEPKAVVGHSVGEVAAAHAAGILELEDAVRVVYHRSRLQQRTAGQGRMLAVGLPARDAETVVALYDGSVSIGAVNSPADVTLSGDIGALDRIADSLETKQIFCRFLQVEVPYHSVFMEPIREELLESLKTLRPRPAAVPMLSTTTGTTVAGPELTASYWWRNVRNTVRFAEAIDKLADTDHDYFLEISPHPVLAGSIAKCIEKKNKEARAVTSLRRPEPDRVMMLASLGKLFTLGYPVDWKRQFPDGGRFVRLPAYPWQREHHWHESVETRRERIGEHVHPMLGYPLKSANPIWSVELDRHRLAFLNDHRVQDAVVFPAAAYVEMALAAGRESFGPGPCLVEDMVLHRAIVLPPSQAVPVQLVADSFQSSFEIFSQTGGSERAWARHASGKLRRRQEGEAPMQLSLQDISARCEFELPRTEFYRQLRRAGLQYGPSFQGVERLWCGAGEAFAYLRLHPDLEAEFSEYLLHPALLDSAFQVLLGAIVSAALQGALSVDITEGIYLPVRIGRLGFYGRAVKNPRVHARLVDYKTNYFTGDIFLLDEEGHVLAEVQGFQCRAIEQPAERIDSYLYEYQWKLQARAGQVFERSANYLPAPSQIAGYLQAEGERLRNELGLSRYDVMNAEGRALASSYVLSALRKLGWNFDLHQQISANLLIEKLGIASHHRGLVHRILQMLAEYGVLEPAGEDWEILRMPERSPDEIWRSLWRQFPGLQAELLLVRQCGERLSEVLAGTLDPLELIFPQGSLTLTEHLYQDAPSNRVYNILVQKAVALALEKLPADKTIRILEVGAGTGGMTAYILRRLPPDRTEYVFSDITELLLGQAEQKFRDFPFMQYKVLDIERDPIAQGYEPHSFDIILASDVLHATRDLRETIGHVKHLLRSNGLLILLELTCAPDWIVMVFGLLKGWWRFTDTDLRPSDPWITQKKWRALLEAEGFPDVACVADVNISEQALHSVIVAQGSAFGEEPAPATEAPSRPEKPGLWLILADQDGIGDQLALRLRAQGERPVLIYSGETYKEKGDDAFEIDPASSDHMQRVIRAALDGGTECRSVVHLWSLDTPPPDRTTLTSLDTAQVQGCFSVLKLTQVLSQIDWATAPRLWTVTSGAYSVGRILQQVSVAQAPVWGLSRTIANEHPNLRSSVIDISVSPRPEEVQSLLNELISDDKEDEIALRGHSRYIHRLLRVSLAKIQKLAHQAASIETSRPFVVEIPTPGILDTLTLREKQRNRPGPQQVEIRVHAASLNFKDIMLGMGLLPDEALEGGYTGRTLGMECAGVISAVGEQVNTFKVGDEVVASGPGCLTSHLLIDADSVVPKPPQISFEEATTAPIAFATAHYCLHHVARIEKGERVLIHAAAGGVGLAAIQLARNAGAEVFATAGTQVKRDLLRALGVQYVMDSRSLAFAEEVMEVTHGEGVDIILNSLAGEAIGKSFSVLRPYGRFVEIGKRDIYENNRIELRPFRNNLSYFAVDLDKLCAERPEYVRTLMRDTIRGFDGTTLYPLAHRVFPVEDCVSAFRYMAQGKHIGKVVVSMRNGEVVVSPPRRKKISFRADGTYLITGGLGGFGLAVAQWMVEHGAQHLVLTGRSGASPDVQAAIDAMRGSGAELVLVKANVTQEREVVALLDNVARCMPPLRGVIHAAMVLDDALLDEFNDERMRTAMAPKVDGAWILHARTQCLPLDMFVLFSSFTSIIGTPRQGNYNAGNAFLDALAHHRRSVGLPALTINWGVVAGAGYVARNPDLGQKLEQFGAKSLPVQQMLEILGVLLQEKAASVGVAHLDWQQLSKMHLIGTSPRFAYLVTPALTEDGGGAGAWLIDALMAVEPSDRPKLLENHIRERLARVLGTSASKIDVDKPLISLGLDSLMAVEIGNRLQSELGVSVPPIKFMEGLTTAGMAHYLLEQLTTGDLSAIATPGITASELESAIASARPASNSANDEAEETDTLAAAVEALSENEVDLMLQRFAKEGDAAAPGEGAL